MGKNAQSSYRKLKKKEKSKTQIKTSKTVLPKGQNVTDTNFKVKKIVIKDQVRQHSDNELLSKKKLSCQELLGRLSHHNSGIKSDSLFSLKELIVEHPQEILVTYLAPLIESISKLLLDESKEIRKESNKLLGNILSQAELHMLSPLFPLMNSYLVCGLTHINSSIREDSLHFLDTLLKWTPSLCLDAIPQILPICLDLMSSSTTNSRSLTLNLESKLTTAIWRRNVLARMSVLLSILRDKDAANHQKLSNETNVIRYNDCKEDGGRVYIPLSQSNVNYNFDNDKLFTKSLAHILQDVQQLNLKEFSELLIPLLFEVFIEMVPVKEKSMLEEETGCTISAEVNVVLKSILDILTSIWDLLENIEETKWFKLTFASSFQNALICGRFPYSMSVSQGDLKKKKDTSENTEDSGNCQTQNITLVKFLFLLTSPKEWAGAIQYLKSCFRNSGKLLPKDCALLITCCKILISSSCIEAKSFLEYLKKFSLCSNKALASQATSALFEIATDNKLSQLHCDPNFLSWLDCLPEQLSKSSLSSKTVDVSFEIARRNFPAFSNSLNGHIEAILDNVPNAKIDGNPEEREDYRVKMAQLLYWTEDWDKEMIESLQKAIANNYWGDYVTGYVKDIFDIKAKEYISG